MRASGSSFAFFPLPFEGLFFNESTNDGFRSFNPSDALKPWISFTSSLRMNSSVSALMTWPGTMMGKPGGYGMTKFADTNSGPFLSRLSISGLDQLNVLTLVFAVGAEEGGADIAFAGMTRGILAEAVVEATEVREIGHVVHQ